MAEASIPSRIVSPFAGPSLLRRTASILSKKTLGRECCRSPATVYATRICTSVVPVCLGAQYSDEYKLLVVDNFLFVTSSHDDTNLNFADVPYAIGRFELETEALVFARRDSESVHARPQLHTLRLTGMDIQLMDERSYWWLIDNPRQHVIEPSQLIRKVSD